jgi:hypothetical protein
VAGKQASGSVQRIWDPEERRCTRRGSATQALTLGESRAMDCDKIRFLVKRTGAGYVVYHECFKDHVLVSAKELGMVHYGKEDALKAMDSLISLTRQTSPHTLIEFEA